MGIVFTMDFTDIYILPNINIAVWCGCIKLDWLFIHCIIGLEE